MRRLCLCAALAAVAIAAVPSVALAAANHPFLGVVGSASYEDACGAAFGPGGLYVSNYYADKIEGPSAIAEEAPAGGPCKLAFDAAGDLYVNNWHTDVVKYETGELRTGAYETIDTESPTGLAVDPASGDLYVTHRTYIAHYAAPVHAGELPTRIGEDPAAAYYGVAISEFPGAGAQPATAGDLYVPDAATNTVAVFDSAGSLVETINGEATPQGGFDDLVDSEAVVDENAASPSYGHLYVLDDLGLDPSGNPKGALEEFNSAGEYRGQLVGFTDAEPSGVAIEASTGNVYVTSGNSEGSAIFKYGPTAPARTLKVTKTGTGGGRVTSAPPGIACGGACVAEFTEGERVELSASPDAHSVFKGWGSAECPGAGSCTILMTHGVEVQPEFEEPAQQTLTVTKTGAGQGTVTSEPVGISCPSTCTEHFAEGRLITLTATPAPHSSLVAWSGCESKPSPDQCRVTMGAPKSVGAEFAPIPQLNLTASTTGSGEGTVASAPAGIFCPGACSAGFDEGSSVTLTEITAPGSAFGGWSGGGCSGTAPTCTVAMAQALSVGAGFVSLLASPPTPPPASSTPAPSSAPPAPPTPAAGGLKLGKLTVKGATATLKLRVSGPGSVTATGKGLKKAGAKASKAGALILRLTLSKAGSRALKSAKHGKLKIEVRLKFTPNGGAAPATATKAVTFRA